MDKKKIWELTETRLETYPSDGQNAEGGFSEVLLREQTAFKKGFRAGRLATVRCIDRHDGAEGPAETKGR